MAHLLITGGTGFIGQRLCKLALAAGHRISVFSRRPAQQVTRICGAGVTVINDLHQIPHLPAIDAVINLAGEPIMEGRWSTARKQILRNSRIDFTRHLLDTLAKCSSRPRALINGSAIGYYGDCGEKECIESSSAGTGFAAQLCRDWEDEAQAASTLGMRVCCVRIGVVLDRDGGALQRMLPAFRLGAGGTLGSGQQWFSWIHRDDLCHLILYLQQQEDCRGAFNGSTPHPVRNAEFTRILAQQLHRPAVLKTPAVALKLLLGESASLLLDSQRVMPAATLASGFQFQYPELPMALDAILKK